MLVVAVLPVQVLLLQLLRRLQEAVEPSVHLPLAALLLQL